MAGLDGPALDACRFASWLVDRGVPAANVTLLLSPSPDNGATTAKLSKGFEVGDATEAEVRDVLFNRLATSSSDLLILYWGGHGVMDGADDPLLLYADASLKDKRNLNLPALLRSMRTRTFDGHPRQLVLVDACLNFVSGLQWTEGMPKDQRYTLGDQDTRRDQQVLLAASPGERAVNVDADQTGLFSRVVREELARTPAEQWPPDPDELRSAVTERFRVLRDVGETDQVPSYIWFTSRNYNGKERFEPADSLRGSLMLERVEYRRLKNILMSAAAPTSLRAIYREVAHSVPGLPRRPEYPDDVLSSVDALRSAVNPLPLFEFLVRLAASFPERPHARLWEWIRATAPSYGVKLRDLEELDDELRRTFFVLRVEPDLLGSGFQVTAWRFAGTAGSQVAADEAPWTLERLAGELAGRSLPCERLADLHGHQRTTRRHRVAARTTELAVVRRRARPVGATVARRWRRRPEHEAAARRWRPPARAGPAGDPDDQRGAVPAPPPADHRPAWHRQVHDRVHGGQGARVGSGAALADHQPVDPARGALPVRPDRSAARGEAVAGPGRHRRTALPRRERRPAPAARSARHRTAPVREAARAAHRRDRQERHRPAQRPAQRVRGRRVRHRRADPAASGGQPGPGDDRRRGQLRRRPPRHVRCNAFPFVVLTSNAEREFPPAFLRRCLRLDLLPPDPTQLTAIVTAHLGPAAAAAADRHVRAFLAKRERAEVTTDQLLNAVYLATSGSRHEGRTPEEVAAIDDVVNAVMRPLTGSE